MLQADQLPAGRGEPGEPNHCGHRRSFSSNVGRPRQASRRGSTAPPTRGTPGGRPRGVRTPCCSSTKMPTAATGARRFWNSASRWPRAHARRGHARDGRASTQSHRGTRERSRCSAAGHARQHSAGDSERGAERTGSDDWRDSSGPAQAVRAVDQAGQQASAAPIDPRRPGRASGATQQLLRLNQAACPAPLPRPLWARARASASTTASRGNGFCSRSSAPDSRHAARVRIRHTCHQHHRGAAAAHQHLTELDSIGRRKHDVEEGHVRTIRQRGIERLAPGSHRDDDAPFVFQPGGQQAEHLRGIIGNEHPRRGQSSGADPCATARM